MKKATIMKEVFEVREVDEDDLQGVDNFGDQEI